MSRVGDVDKMYGKNFSIVTTNASASDILNDNESSFIEASLILASPIDENGNDLGYPTLLATDADGNPIRLTYTIKPGNGLVLSYSYAYDKQDFSEVISLAIDSDTLQTTEQGNLYVSGKGLTENSEYLTVDDGNNIEVDIDKLIDNNRLVVTKIPESEETGSYLINRISVNAAKIIDGITLVINRKNAKPGNLATHLISVNLPKIIDNSTIQTTKDIYGRDVLVAVPDKMDSATSTSYGVVKIDNSTIKTNPNGNIYVDTTKLRLIGPKGGVGIIRLAPRGTADLYVDSVGIVRTDPKNMPKCNVVNSSKNSGGFGVCAVDGKTIMATHDGVLKVISSGLIPASTSDLGVVKPDNKTITIDKSGTISVNANNLPAGTATIQGLLKIDNSTIVKNAQGQISIANARKWDNAISNLSTRIAAFSEHLAAVRSDLVNTLSGITNAKNPPFNVYTSAGKELTRLSLVIPNVKTRINGVNTWNTADCDASFTIKYASGYKFKFSLSGTSGYSWLSSCNIIVNGQVYAQNREISLSSDTAVCSLQININGYGNEPLERAIGSWSIDFRDSTGNPLKSIMMTIYNSKHLRKMSDFSATINGDNSDNNVAVNASSASVSSLVSRDKGEAVVASGNSVILTSLTRATK